MKDKNLVPHSLVEEMKKGELLDKKHKATVIAEFAKILMEANINEELIYDIVMHEFYADVMNDIGTLWL